MVREFEWFLADEAATLRAGEVLAKVVSAAIVFLHGNLGMGKTTLSRGVLQGLGHQGRVKSPTYTLVEPYELSGGRLVYHFDLYRLSDPEELEYLGIRDYFDEESLCLIEWPERGEGVLPQPDIEIELKLEGRGRKLNLKSGTDLGSILIERMNQHWMTGETIS